MGGTTFTTRVKGKTANDAFRAAVAQAQYDHGHGGYSGTIAEKNSFTLISLPSLKNEGWTPEAMAGLLIEKGDSRIDDKRGPAGCFDLGNGEFLFFGWASC